MCQKVSGVEFCQACAGKLVFRICTLQDSHPDFRIESVKGGEVSNTCAWREIPPKFSSVLNSRFR